MYISIGCGSSKAAHSALEGKFMGGCGPSSLPEGRKGVYPNPRLKINRIINFSCIQMFFTAFVLCILIKLNTEGKTINSKLHCKVTKLNCSTLGASYVYVDLIATQMFLPFSLSDSFYKYVSFILLTAVIPTLER